MSPGRHQPSLNRIEVLLEAAANDKTLIAAVGAAVLDNDVYVLGTGTRPTPNGEPLDDNTPVNLVMLNAPNGPIIPFFSSEAVMNMVLEHHPGTETRHLRLQGRTLFAMTRGHHLVLNPDRAHGKVFTPAEVTALLSP